VGFLDVAAAGWSHTVHVACPGQPDGEAHTGPVCATGREVAQKQRRATCHSLWLLKVKCWHSKGFASYAEVLNHSSVDN